METTYKALVKTIKNSKNILIMTHKDIDLDALSSSLAMSLIIKKLSRNCDILLNKKNLNLSVKKALDVLEDEYSFVSKSKLDITSYDLLIILDTSKKELVEEITFLGSIPTVVIDHHVVTNKNILETKISYINSHLSSTCEFVVGLIKYLNMKIPAYLATIMLAGLEIDTNHYRVKTGAATFLTSATLMLFGASSILKQELLKEEFDLYQKRVDYIKNSYMINGHSICVINEIVSKEELSIISEKLLTFEGVSSAFTIGFTYDKIVSISARSLGVVDVYLFMKEFDGGGHLTEAAAQIKTSDIDSVVTKLEKLLR